MATSLKDLSQHSDDTDNVGTVSDGSESETETYAVKYLGNTIIEAARSEEATAEAIKSVILTAKGM